MAKSILVEINSDLKVIVEPKKQITVCRQTADGWTDLTFKVGDEAEFHSYNLIYTGKISSITEKNVSVYDDCDKKNVRLPLERFAHKNWNFDKERIEKANSAESYYI